MEAFDGIVDLLRNDGSIITNKNLAFAIGKDEADIYSELMSKYLYFKDNDMLTKDGYFYNTVDNLRLDTTLTGKQQRKAIKKLEKLNLIKTDLRGLPPKRHFKPVKDLNILSKFINQGRQKRKELKEKLEENAAISKNRYNGRIKSDNKAETNVTKQRVNNTKGTILSNNTKTNRPKRVSTVYFADLNSEQYSKYAMSVINYFVQQRLNLKGYHTKFKPQTWYKIIDKIESDQEIIVDGLDVIVDKITDEMIDTYFQREFSQPTDYNLTHFLDDGILGRLYLEVVGRG